MKIKPIPILLALSLTISMLTPALASEITTPGNTSTSDIPLTVQATTLSVTVPTQLPVTIDSEGTHTYATDVTISNSSSGPVSVTGISMQTKNSWELASYSDNMSAQPVGSKKLGFRINGSETVSNSNSLQSIPEHFGPISSGGKLSLDYAANIPPQDKAITTTSIADVIFTIDWYTGGNSVAETDKGLLALDRENLQMMPGTQEVIYATYQETPSTLMLMSLDESTGIDWASSNPSAATVENGVVTGVGTGNTVITAKANDLVATCSVTVVEPPVPLTAIAFSKHSTSIVNGMEETVLVLYNPEKFTGATDLTLTSANESIVKATPTSINGVTASDGPTAIKLQAVGTGSTTITASATTSSGLVTDTINVAVTQPLTGLEITGETSVKVGETIQLTANKLPANTTDNGTVTWSSSDTSVATVDSNGVVTGIGIGDVDLQGKCNNIAYKICISVERGNKPVLAWNKSMNRWYKNVVFSLENTPDTIPNNTITYDLSVSKDKSIIGIGDAQNLVVYTNGGCMAPESCSVLFQANKFEYIDVSALDTSQTTNMDSMFSSPYTSDTEPLVKQVIVGLDNFDTSKVTSMRSMFSAVPDSDFISQLSGWDTSNLTDTTGMFNTTQIESIGYLSNWDTSKLTRAESMFANCSNLKTIGDIKRWNLSNLESANGLFLNCSSLEEINLSNVNISSIRDFRYAFNSTSIKKVIISGSGLYEKVNMTGIFKDSGAYIDQVVVLSKEEKDTLVSKSGIQESKVITLT